MFSSILTFDFDLILGQFLTFWGPNGLFWGLESGAKIVLGCNNKVQQLLFPMFYSILTFDFLGLFLTFWGPNGLFLCSKTVLNNFHFL